MRTEIPGEDYEPSPYIDYKSLTSKQQRDRYLDKDPFWTKFEDTHWDDEDKLVLREHIENPKTNDDNSTLGAALGIGAALLGLWFLS